VGLYLIFILNEYLKGPRSITTVRSLSAASLRIVNM